MEQFQNTKAIANLEETAKIGKVERMSLKKRMMMQTIKINRIKIPFFSCNNFKPYNRIAIKL